MNDILSEKDARALDQILIRQLDVRPEQLVPEAKIMGDLGADSLDVVEISMSVEEEFNLTISDERWEQVETVAALYQTVAELLLKQRSL